MKRLDQELEEDLSWREAELGSLKLQVAQSESGSAKHNALLRAMWAMLYAHFEGFSKFTWDLYLEKLQALELDRQSFKPEICKLSLHKDLKNLKGDLSSESLWDFCGGKFQRLMNEKLKFDTKLETDSNLWPNLFKDNIYKICLHCSSIDEFQTHIKSLVARRNDIAHGKKLVIKSLIEYQEYENAALLVMHELAIAVVEAIETKSYLR